MSEETAILSARVQQSKQRRTRINPAQKQALFNLFDRKQWVSLPLTTAGDDLDMLTNNLGLSRNQVSTQFRAWTTKQIMGIHQLPETSENLLVDKLQDLEQRCDNITVLIHDTKKSHPITMLLSAFSSHITPAGVDKILDVQVWAPVRSKLLSLIADNRSRTVREHSIRAKYYLQQKLELLANLREQFDGFMFEFAHTFGMQFIETVERCLATEDRSSKDAAAIKEVFANHNDISKTPEGAKLYYIAGYMLCAIENAGRRRLSKGVLFVSFVQKHSLNKYQKVLARMGSLLTQDIELVDAGALHYPSIHWYELVVVLERIYVELLSMDCLEVYGSKVVDNVYQQLLAEKQIRKCILEGLQYDEHEGDVLVTAILNIFTNFQGKDFVTKMLSRAKNSLVVATRTYQKTVSDPKVHVKRSMMKCMEASSSFVIPANEFGDSEEFDQQLVNVMEQLESNQREDEMSMQQWLFEYEDEEADFIEPGYDGLEDNLDIAEQQLEVEEFLNNEFNDINK